MKLANYESFLESDKINAVFRANYAIAALKNASLPNNLLDVGCGSGELLRLARAHGIPEVVGVDGVQDALDACKDISAKLYDVDLNLSGLPFQDGQFDAVTCLEVLEHLYAPQNTLKEIARVTAPGGYVVVSVPNQFNYSMRLRILLGHNISDPARIGGHIKFFRPMDLKAICEHCGFQQVKIAGLPYPTARKRYGVLAEMVIKMMPGIFATWLFAYCQKPNN